MDGYKIVNRDLEVEKGTSTRSVTVSGPRSVVRTNVERCHCRHDTRPLSKSKSGEVKRVSPWE